jgi:RND family efflux transporter MFP subunit
METTSVPIRWPLVALWAFLPPAGGNAQSAAAPTEIRQSSDYLEVTGSLDPLEQVELYAKVSGYVEAIHVDIGDRVRAGEKIAVLSIPEMEPELRRARTAVVEARSRLAKARADADLSQVTYERFAGLHAREPGAITLQEVEVARAQQSVSSAQVEVARSALEAAQADAERLEALMAYASIEAPFDGVITKRYVDTGALVVAGTGGGKPLVEIMRTDRLRLVLHVPESAVSSVKPGTPAIIAFDTNGEGDSIQAAITRCSGSLLPDTRTMRAEIELTNEDGKLKPGMFASVQLRLEPAEPGRG